MTYGRMCHFGSSSGLLKFRSTPPGTSLQPPGSQLDRSSWTEHSGYSKGGSHLVPEPPRVQLEGQDLVPEPPRVQPEGLGSCTRAAAGTTRGARILYPGCCGYNTGGSDLVHIWLSQGHQPYDILRQERRVKREFRTGPSGASKSTQSSRPKFHTIGPSEPR